MAACLVLQRRPSGGDASCLLKTVSGGGEEELSRLKVHCGRLQRSRCAHSSARKRRLHPSCGGNGCKQKVKRSRTKRTHLKDENVNKLAASILFSFKRPFSLKSHSSLKKINNKKNK